METITILNKSGKVVSTSKHIFNIFKDAKGAYQEKKAEIRADIQQKNQEKLERRLENVRLEDSRSEASSRRSHRTHRSGRRDGEVSRRPGTALTERNLVAASEASVSVAGSRHGSRPATSYRSPTEYDAPRYHRSPTEYDAPRPATSHRSPTVYYDAPRPATSHRSPTEYGTPYYENSNISRPSLPRYNTDYPPQYYPPQYEPAPMVTVAQRYDSPPPLQRSMTSPNLHSEEIDMNLAYGEIPPPLPMVVPPAQREQELQGLMSKLDHLMVEAHCVQHTATTIIASLQSNPEAMAAVGLTLAEISNVLAKMGPGILTALKGSSPAIFALLCSPQFLIAGGVAVGVTVVMFGGYKIIKKIQEEIAERKVEKQERRMDEAMVFDADNYSVESWRQGIAEVELQSVSTSVDGEFITPKAEKLRKHRIRERAQEERMERMTAVPSSPSIASSSASTVRRKPLPVYMDSSRTVVTESARSHRSSRTMKTDKTSRTSKTSKTDRSDSTVKPRKDGKEGKEKKPKKQSALSSLFKGSSTTKKSDKMSSKASEVMPRRIEM